jgi:ParB family protein of integrating conjugative element (PFGI_1 class)
MADLTPHDLAVKLRGEPFRPGGPHVAKASDPIADTAMVVTLDELRPYELNPRIVRNPRYDDIKASVRERGLEAPPAITRRPGEAHYIIRNGGNTRLSILNELWQETKDERFFRIPCLFRPWTSRGEILALTGHLAENELRGELTFIERALGVEKLREFHERETGGALTQKELSDRLKRDGYPISQSHISRMQDAIHHLLPSIPKILYGGLGKPKVERLIALRRGAQRIFERYAAKKAVAVDFDGLFHDVSAAFDLEPATFNVQRLQDELIGQMANLLGADYDALMLALVDAETWQESLLQEPTAAAEVTPAIAPAAPNTSQSARPASSAPTRLTLTTGPEAVVPVRTPRESPASQATLSPVAARANEDGPTKPSMPESEARQAATPHHVRQALSELWDITPAIDASKHLRERIDALAREIADEAHMASSIEGVEDGIGFVCHRPTSSGTQTGADAIRARAMLSILSSLTLGYTPRWPTVDGVHLIDDLAPLLLGVFPDGQGHSTATRLSDEGLLKLYRLIRLARRLVDLESARAHHANPPCDPR